MAVGVKGRIILDPRPLNVDVVPDTLLHRRNELQMLELFFKPLLEELDYGASIPIIVSIDGKHGVGKTHLVEYFYLKYLCPQAIPSLDESKFSEISNNMQRLSKYCQRKSKIIRIRISAYTMNLTVNQLLATISNKLRLLIQPRGLSPQEILNVIFDYLRKNDKYLLLVLDDFQYSLMRRGDEVAKFIVRLYEDYEDERRIHTIFIMDDLNTALGYVDDVKTRNEMKINYIHLAPYLVNEMYDILWYRAQKALHPSAYDDEIIEYIATNVGCESKENCVGYLGSARVGIEVLLKAALSAEYKGKNRIDFDDVRSALSSILERGEDLLRLDDILRNLNEHELLFLLAVARTLAASSGSKGGVLIGEVEEEYRRICEALGIEPRKHTQVYTYAKRLAQLGVIKRSVGGKNMRGRSSIISIDVPVDKFEKKIKELLKLRGLSDIENI